MLAAVLSTNGIGPRALIGSLSYFCQRIRNRAGNFSRARATKFLIYDFEPPDEVEDVAAQVWATGGGAEMRATTERAISINHTAPGVAFEQGTRAVGGVRKLLAPGGAKGFGRDEGFAFGQVRRPAGELKATTLRAGLAIARHRALCQFCIHRPDFTKGVLYLVSPHATLEKLARFNAKTGLEIPMENWRLDGGLQLK